MNKTILVATGCMLIAGAAVAKSKAQFGDVITCWPKDPGAFLFVNAQAKVDAAQLEKPILALRKSMKFDLKFLQGEKPDLRSIPAALDGLGAKGAVWIVDDPTLPVCLVATESGWGILNVAQLVADAPDQKKLAKRLQKFIYRTFANVHGAGDPPMMPACVMKQAVGVEGVDKLPCATYSPETITKVTGFMKKLGYKQCRRGTYYDACEEGWAPAPTNDAQKAIWDRVHEMPSKPLTIKPEK